MAIAFASDSQASSLPQKTNTLLLVEFAPTEDEQSPVVVLGGVTNAFLNTNFTNLFFSCSAFSSCCFGGKCDLALEPLPLASFKRIYECEKNYDEPFLVCPYIYFFSLIFVDLWR